MSMRLLLRTVFPLKSFDGGESESLLLSLSRMPGLILVFELRSKLQDFLFAWRDSV